MSLVYWNIEDVLSFHIFFNLVAFRKSTLSIISGQVGGSHYLSSGGAAEYLCLPNHPQWGSKFTKAEKDGGHANAYVFGAEYQTGAYSDPRKNLHDYDVPCAVCLTKKSTVSMFPG